MKKTHWKKYFNPHQAFLFIGIYFCGARFGHFLSYPDSSVATIWPPSGIYIAALVCFSPRYWPQFLAGALLADFASDVGFQGKSFAASVGFWMANTSEAIVAAVLIRRFIPQPFRSRPSRDLMILVAISTLVAGPLSAAAASVVLEHILEEPSNFDTTRIWWSSCVLGTILTAPLALILRRPREFYLKLKLRDLLVLTAALATLAGLCDVVFLEEYFSQPELFASVIFPLVIWIAYAFQYLGATLASVVVIAFATYGTTRSLGPFAGPNSDLDNLLHLQIFLLTMTMSGLLLASVRRKRERVINLLRVNNIGLKRRSCEARKAAATMSRFLAAMSHELRIPLTSILGFTDILLAKSREPEDCKDLEVIRRNGQHMLSLMNQMIDLNRIESGRFRSESSHFSLRQLLEETTASFEVQASTNRITLKAEIEDNVPATVYSDPIRIKQVLWNLVGNAIKVTSSGEVAVHLSMTQDLQRRFLRFEVRDTGPGISKDDFTTLFLPFSQIKSGVQKNIAGSGLGLALAKGICTAMGGSIEVTSELGRGSIFAFQIPLASDQINRVAESAHYLDQTIARATADLASSKPKRVLVAEDVVDLQNLMKMILRGAGFEVDIAENGRIAIQKALDAQSKSAGFDAILMDMQMPEIGGLDAVKQLRNLGYRLPIFALTANAMVGDRELCLASGCDGYIEKPINRHKLLNLLTPSI